MKIHKILPQVQAEDQRRLRLARTFASLVQESSFKDQLHNYQSSGRQIASFFARFLEGQLFDQDVRCQLRFLRDSYAIGGIIPEETLTLVEAPTHDCLASLTEHFEDETIFPIDREFKEIREIFELVGLVQPDEEFSRLLEEEGDVTNSFERIDGLFEWAEKLQESNREPTEDEEKILLYVSRWNFQDRGVSRRLFLSTESEEGVPDFFADLLKDFGLASFEADELLEGLKQLANGVLNIDQFMDKFDASEDLEEEDVRTVGDELLETLGPDFLSKLQDAVLEADQADQKRGRRKAKRRMIR